MSVALSPQLVRLRIISRWKHNRPPSIVITGDSTKVPAGCGFRTIWNTVGNGGPYILYASVGALNTLQVIAVDDEGNQSSPGTLMVDPR
jgi:hypothetical protein